MWTTDNKCDLAEACSYKDRLVTPTAHIPYPLWLVIRKLCQEVKVEWQMLLSGEVNGNLYDIKGYYITKQVVTGTSVEDIDNLTLQWYKDNNIIATIHSHGTMNVFFSSTDDTNNKNSPVACHIVVNNADEYVACVRTTLPCGMEAFVGCNIEIETSKEKVTIEGFDKIQKGVVQTTFEYPNSNWANKEFIEYPTGQQVADFEDDLYRKAKKKAGKTKNPWWDKNEYSAYGGY